MWTHRNTFAIGGLQNVGYAPKQDFLIVLSSQGEGIFDCISGEKIDRLHNDMAWLERIDETTSAVTGFGCLENIQIPISGSYGDYNHPKKSADGWTLSALRPVRLLLFKSASHHVYLTSPDNQKKSLIAEEGACELRAFGFSDTGRSLIVALSCELIIYSRV